MKPTTLFLFLAFLFFPPAAAWGATCTGNAGGTNNWGPVGTVTTDCGAPDGTDIFVFPDGEDVVVQGANVVFTADGAGFTIQDGATFTANAVDEDDSIDIIFWRGQDDYPGDGETDVAAFFESGAVVDIRGGWAQWGDDTPQLQTDVSAALDTIWTADLMVPCGDGSDDTIGGIGGAGDCSTGSEEYTFCLIYTTARNDPEDGNGNGGENYLDESIGDLEVQWGIQPLEPSMDYGQFWPIRALDSTGSQYQICIDPRQVDENYIRNSGDRAHTDRATVLVEISVDVEVGDTCIDLAAGTLSADGDGVDYYFRLIGDAMGRANKIAKALDDEKCDGTAGGDSLHFSELNPMRDAKTAGADTAVITPIGLQQGDMFGVLAPVRLINNDGTYADDQAKIIIESTDVTLSGVVTQNIGLFHMRDGAYLNPESDSVHALGGGRVMFENMSRVDLSCWSKIGGDVSGGNVAFEFADIADMTHGQDIRIKYSGDWGILTSGSAMGRAEFKRLSCEMISHSTAGNEGCIKNADDWSDVVVDLIACHDCVGGSVGSTAPIFGSQTNTMVVTGALVYGMQKGVIASMPASNGVQLYNLLGRGLISNRGALPFVGLYTDGFDIQDYSSTTDLMAFAPYIGAFATTLKNGILADVSIHNDELLGIDEGPATGGELSNLIIWNAQTDNTTGTSDVIQVLHDADASTTSTLEHTTIGWDEGVTSDWDTAIAAIGDDGTETAWNFSSILVTGHAGSDNDTDYISIDLDSDIIDELVNRTDGNICVHAGSVAAGGAGSYTAVDDMATYVTKPILGRGVQLEPYTFNLVFGSLLHDWGCGAKTGSRAPGVNPNGNCWLYEQMGAECPTRPYIVNDGSGAF